MPHPSGKRALPSHGVSRERAGITDKCTENVTPSRGALGREGAVCTTDRRPLGRRRQAPGWKRSPSEGLDDQRSWEEGQERSRPQGTGKRLPLSDHKRLASAAAKIRKQLPVLGARGFAENTQLPTLLKKSSQGCPGVWTQWVKPALETGAGAHGVLSDNKANESLLAVFSCTITFNHHLHSR